MRQRTAFAVATVLTTFLLVIAAGVLARLAVVPPNDAGAQDAPLATVTATSGGLTEQREAEYQRALQTASAQVEQANQQLADVYARLTAQPTIVLTATITDAPTGVSLSPVPTPPTVVDVVPTEPLPVVTAVAPPVLDPTPTVATGIITPDQAVAAARAYAGGGTVERVRLEEEHGQRVYEVRFTDNSRVYVDPVNGRVIYARLEGRDGSNDD